MNLSDDLHILRQLQVPYKYELILWVAHLFTDHAEAMKGLDGKQLKDLIYSNTPVRKIAEILEDSTEEGKNEWVTLISMEVTKRPTTRRPASDRRGAISARQSSKHTDSPSQKSKKKS